MQGSPGTSWSIESILISRLALRKCARNRYISFFHYLRMHFHCANTPQWKRSEDYVTPFTLGRSPHHSAMWVAYTAHPASPACRSARFLLLTPWSPPPWPHTWSCLLVRIWTLWVHFVQWFCPDETQWQMRLAAFLAFTEENPDTGSYYKCHKTLQDWFKAMDPLWPHFIRAWISCWFFRMDICSRFTIKVT